MYFSSWVAFSDGGKSSFIMSTLLRIKIFTRSGEAVPDFTQCLETGFPGADDAC